MVEDLQKKENLEEKVKSGGALSLVLRHWKEHPVMMGTVTLGLAAIWVMPQFYTSKTSSVKERYHQLQAQYADTNRDGSISPEEKDVFDKDLFRGHGGVLSYTHLTCTPSDQSKFWQCRHGNIPSLRYSSTGKEVPPETVLKWMDEYVPARH